MKSKIFYYLKNHDIYGIALRYGLVVTVQYFMHLNDIKYRSLCILKFYEHYCKVQNIGQYVILAKNSITVHPVMPKTFCHMLFFECLFHLGMETNKSRHNF